MGWEIWKKLGRIGEKGEAVARQVFGANTFHLLTELTLFLKKNIYLLLGLSCSVWNL